MKDILLSALSRATGTEISDIELEFPARLEHGDYTTNIALKQKGENPRSYAQTVVNRLNEDEDLSKTIEKIEIAGPGFINFFIKQDALNVVISHALSDEVYGHSQLMKGKKIIVEFTDPNPFKELHIGHLYDNVVGESISRMFESQGATVKRACYQGDVGLHVAKSLWGMKQMISETSLEELSMKSIQERVKFLGQAYAKGSRAYEDNESAKSEIVEINKQVFAKDHTIFDLYKTGRTWSLEYFDEIYKRVGTKFDFHFFESEVSDEGIKLVKENMQNGIFQESDGAIVFKGEQYGLHTRVFINSHGLPTYEAKELALAPKKKEMFDYDLSIIITANEVNEYFKVLLKALSLINPELQTKTEHIGHGFVKLSSGKMSSRTGNIVTAESVLDEAHEYALDIQKQKDDQTAEMIGQAAIKYAFLKNNIGGDIEFDIKKSVSFQGNSGPYLQYTAVRIKSLLAKASNQQSEITRPLDEAESALARVLTRFTEIVSRAAEGNKPNIIADYLYTLSSQYNVFYDSQKIIGEERESQRLSLSKLTLSVLTNGLWLLGISVPDKM